MDQQKNHRQQIAAKVRAAREERGWSQERLADEAGVSPNTVLSIEQESRKTQPGKLRPVLDVLGLAPVSEVKLDLEGVPDDVVTFFIVMSKRARVMSDEQRAAALARLYPALLLDKD